MLATPFQQVIHQPARPHLSLIVGEHTPVAEEARDEIAPDLARLESSAGVLRPSCNPGEPAFQAERGHERGSYRCATCRWTPRSSPPPSTRPGRAGPTGTRSPPTAAPPH